MIEATEQPLVGTIDIRQLRHFLVSRRRACGWTQEELAERSGVSVRTIRNIETGSNINPRRASAELLLAAFGNSLSQLASEVSGQAIGPTTGALPARQRGGGLQSDNPESTVDPVRWRGPRPVTEPIVGRAEDLRHVLGTLRRGRVMVLTGPGGVGKTRLALSAAARMQSLFSDGVAVVELGHCAPERLDETPGAGSHERVRQAVLAALPANRPGSGERAGRTERGETDLLLIIDNAEHVVRSVSQVVLELQVAHPGLRVLITSRRPLPITSADVWEVAPLDTRVWSGADAPPPAVELFLRRVRSAVPNVNLTSRMPLVIELCRRLEGFPRAIETAAYCVRSVPLESLLRSGSTLRLLDQVHLTTASRHRSLAESVRWSYDLLAPRERALLHHLAGSFETFTVEDVMRARPACRDGEIGLVAGLAELADASLIHVHRGARYEYRMYRMVREFVAALDRRRMPARSDFKAVARSA